MHGGVPRVYYPGPGYPVYTLPPYTPRVHHTVSLPSPMCRYRHPCAGAGVTQGRVVFSEEQE